MNSAANCYLTLVVLTTITVSISADLTTLDCPLRQIGLDYASSLQPFHVVVGLLVHAATAQPVTVQSVEAADLTWMANDGAIHSTLAEEEEEEEGENEKDLRGADGTNNGWTITGRCDGTCCFDRAIGPYMVLQRDAPARVWGTAAPSTGVNITVHTVSGAEPTITTESTINGTWLVDLPARAATTQGHTLVLTCANATAPANMVLAKDIVFGDVFGCHGQSNMQFGLFNDMNASTACVAAAAFPDVRFTSYAARQDWSIPDNATACEPGRFQPFSAVCWYYGRDMFLKINAGKGDKDVVPVGLVASQVGGTPVEAWSGPDALARCNQSQVVDRVSTLWHSLIVPLLPMQLSGWVWYQGENNVAGSLAGTGNGCCSIGCAGPGVNACKNHCQASAALCANYYGCQFSSMIEDWRAKWNGGMVVPQAGRPRTPRPFVFVLLAAYEGPITPATPLADTLGNVALLRVQQQKALSLPGVGMAGAFDWGDMASPNGNIHPRWKAPVGERLAVAAAPLVYGAASFAPVRHPTIVTAEAVRPAAPDGGWQVRLTFDVALTRAPPLMDGGVAAAPGGCQPDAAGSITGQCAYFAVDGVQFTGSAVVMDHTRPGTAVLITGVGKGDPHAPTPRVASYGWGNWPVVSLWGVQGGFPAIPFQMPVTEE